MKPRAILLMTTIFPVSLLAFPQNKVEARNSRPPTVAEALQQHHIALTPDSLLIALRNKDAEVRGLAAAELAELKVPGADSAISSAMDHERIPFTRVNMAYALTQLRREKGISTLVASCESRTIPGFVALTAASYLLNLGDQSCKFAVLRYLNSSADPDVMQAASLLPRFSLTAEEKQLVNFQMRQLLKSSSPTTRIAIAGMAPALADAGTLAALQNAIAVEQDDTVRSAMQSSMDAATQKPQ